MVESYQFTAVIDTANSQISRIRVRS